MNLNVAVCYSSYLIITIALTVWVARTLHASGRVFLVDAFRGNEALADSVNHLLVVGFYLINIGYIALALTTQSPMDNFRQIIELESVKIGIVLLILGAMHFFNILVFAKMRARAGSNGPAMPPPAPPQFAGAFAGQGAIPVAQNFEHRSTSSGSSGRSRLD